MTTIETLHANAQKIQAYLDKHGKTNFQVKSFSSSTRTAQDAADTLGVAIGAIVKSLLFRTKKTKKPILVLASGLNRVNEKQLAKLVGEKIERASADFVKEVTGFSIGGVPPVAHKQSIRTFIDNDLLSLSILWAAAGTPNTVFSLTPEELLQLSQGECINVQ